MVEPLVGLVIPVFNNESTLEKTVRSIIGQGYGRWVLVIIDDHSTDDSLTLARSLAHTDERIRVVANPSNLGMVANWISGLSQLLDHESCYFVCLLDPEDMWSPEWLGTLVGMLSRDTVPSIAVSGINYCWPRKYKSQVRLYASLGKGTTSTELLKEISTGYGGIIHGLWRAEVARWLTSQDAKLLKSLLLVEDAFVAYLIARFGLVANRQVLMRKLKGAKELAQRGGGDSAFGPGYRSLVLRLKAIPRVQAWLLQEWCAGHVRGGLVRRMPVFLFRVQLRVLRTYGLRGAN